MRRGGGIRRTAGRGRRRSWSAAPPSAAPSLGAELPRGLHDAGRTAYAACVEANGEDAARACAERAAAGVEACVADHCEAPERPACGEGCAEDARAFYAACVERTGEVEACGERARAGLAACEERCGGEEPPPPPPADGEAECRETCHDRVQAADALCRASDLPAETCDERLAAGLRACVERCSGAAPAPAPADPCADRCAAAAGDVLAQCVAASNPRTPAPSARRCSGIAA
ncbi:MAG: hypothetical protein H6706_05035 [Myxococcales bacterium]|nr:hypothetical protein [Myxococcales bacterium]